MQLDFTISGLGDWGEVSDDLLQRLGSGIREELEYIREQWKEAVEAAGPAAGGNWKAYVKALESDAVIQHPVNGDLLHGKVSLATFPAAKRSELGGKSWDMKPGILAGPKARVGKRGQKYNIIPLGFKALQPGAFSPGRTSGMMVGTSPFRVVSSDRSPADSWIYPEQEGLHLITTVKKDITQHVREHLAEILAEWKT